MTRNTKKFLFDIQKAVDLVRQFTHEKTLDQYRGDPMLRSAVERQLEIAGEALGRAVQLDPSLATTVKDAKRIIGFRNRLAHGYDEISDEMVWSIVESYVPQLAETVSRLIGKPCP